MDGMTEIWNWRPTSEDARTIEPYAVMSSNGYYYLIAGNPKYPEGLTNFRIDRILQIQMLDEPRKPLPSALLPYFRDAAHEVFQASEYRNDHPVMYSDETVRIHLSCDPVILNNLVDDFGWSIQTPGYKRSGPSRLGPCNCKSKPDGGSCFLYPSL